MANSSFSAESSGSLPPAPKFCRWIVPDRPLQLQLSLDLIDRLECEALNRFKAVATRGSEIGGVLLGRIEQDGANRTITIEQCELVPCAYSRSRLYLLSEGDLQLLRQTVDRYGTANQGLSVVGFFRSNTRMDLAMDDEDLGVLKECFANPDCVFLLVKPFSSKPSIAAFFLWKNGQVHGPPELQFPFRRSELQKSAGKGSAPATAHQAPREKPAVPNPGGEPPVKPFEPAPAAAPEVAGRSIRILNPEPPSLLVDSRMRAEWDLAAATRAGKAKKYLLRLKQYLCKHPNLLWIENVPADDSSTGQLQSVWQCTECRATIHRDARQPYACEEARETSQTPPPAAPSAEERSRSVRVKPL
jgi:hypothetical protein